jgi:hypothetical protein
LKSHPAVPPEDAKWCHDFMYDSDPPVTFHRACLILRRRLFPFHYDPYPWVKGRDETNAEVLKSLMAIYLYRAEVQNLRGLKEDPADFNSHLYQPELGEQSFERVHHREDHNHLLKRIVSCLREGHLPGLDLRYLKEALHDPNTGLTYEALIGKNNK